MHRTPRSLLPALALTGLMVAGCGSASQIAEVAPAASSPRPTAPPRTAQLPLDGVSTDLPEVGDAMPAFRSPSGNIVCRLDEEGARCDIGDYAFTPPDRPSGCDDGWGGTLMVNETGGFFACDVPSLAGNSPELAYGRSTVIGDYGCTSQRTGVTCLNTDTEHGFTVSRDRSGTF